jgi:hypothetical protein
MSSDALADRSPQLSRIVDSLGPTLLRVTQGSQDRFVGGLSIVDPTDGNGAEAARLFLGIGVTEADAAAALLADLGKAHAAALLLKAPLATDAAVLEAAGAADVTVVEVSRGAAWGQLFILLRRLVEPTEAGLSDDGSGDLFQLANEVSALVDAPITIENTTGGVLAFSPGQDGTDDGRVRTILGRQVPEQYQQTLTDKGVFQELSQSADPVYIPSFAPGNLPRTAIAVRAGDTVLGFIWAVVREPPTEQSLRALKAAADIVAIQLLRERVASAAGSRLRTEQLAVLLTRSGDPAESARRLGVTGLDVCVMAVELGGGSTDAERAAELQRVSTALGIHLRLVHRATAVATLGDVVYGLVPVHDEPTGLQVADEFVGRSGSRHPLRAGVGRVVEDPADVATSRADADDVLRVLRFGHRATASARSVRTDLMILRLADVAGLREMPQDGHIARLLRHDAEHRTDLTGTLEAYLDRFGEVSKAAADLHVHPNTFRYRLARLSEVGGIDLDDADARLAAMIDLRLYRYRGLR